MPKKSSPLPKRSLPESKNKIKDATNAKGSSFQTVDSFKVTFPTIAVIPKISNLIADRPATGGYTLGLN